MKKDLLVNTNENENEKDYKLFIEMRFTIPKYNNFLLLAKRLRITTLERFL